MTNSSLPFDWPPPFNLKRHPRARHVKLKASVHHGLELVVPMRFSQKHIPDILESNKSWIIKRLNEIAEESKLIHHQQLPTCVHFPAVDLLWQIDYVKTDNAKLRLISRPQQSLAILGNYENNPICNKLLNLWVKKQAKIHLVNLLDNISQQTKLNYNHVTIRGQQTRWGSCSSDKSISLNYKLLFLPKHLVTHILIHELSHTVHMNHSAKFWRLVSTLDPDWKENTRQTRQAESYVPGWAR